MMLTTRNLTATYGEGVILHGVSLDAPEGRITALVGRNGAGKTTTLKSIMGLVRTPSGTVLLDGKNLTHLPTYDRAKAGIGYVPQGREIFPELTVRENLLLGLEANRGEGSIDDELFELFPVLRDFLDRKGGDLSGGQQQQLAIGRALVTRPRLLVLDEPTEGIQPSIIKDIGRALEYLRSKGTMAILLVEQYFDFAKELADSYAVLDRGEVVIAGSKDEVDPEQVRAKIAV